MHSLRHVLCPKENIAVPKGCDIPLNETVITENKSKGNKNVIQTRGPMLSSVLLVQCCGRTRICTSRHYIFQISFSHRSGSASSKCNSKGKFPNKRHPAITRCDGISYPYCKVIKDLTPKTHTCLGPHSGNYSH